MPGDGIARIASEFCAFGNIGPVFGGLGKSFLASSAVQFYVIHVSHGISIKRDGLRLLLPVRGTPCLGMLGAFRTMLASCGSGRLSVWLLWWGVEEAVSLCRGKEKRSACVRDGCCAASLEECMLMRPPRCPPKGCARGVLLGPCVGSIMPRLLQRIAKEKLNEV